MKTYMQAMLQTTQYMFTNKQTGMHDIQNIGSNYSEGISNK